jgi:hypothetical protein
VSKWLQRDLIRRVEGLGLPLTAVVPDKTPAQDASSGKSMDDNARDSMGAWGIMVSRKHAGATSGRATPSRPSPPCGGSHRV